MRITTTSLLLAAFGAFAVFGVGFFLARTPVSPAVDDRFVVVTTIFPLAELARAVGGEDVEVITLVPPGVEAHEFSPSVRELAEAATSADVFISVGSSFDSWATETAAAVQDRGGVSFVSSEYLDLLTASAAHDEHEAEEDHAHEGNDPHFWLDPVRMMVLVPLVEQIFITSDPGHAEAYHARSLAYLEDLQELHNSFEASLATCEDREIVVTHDAYAYLAARYDLDVHAILGLSPEDEPSVGELAALAATITEENVSTIFFEERAGSVLAQMLVDELGVTAAVLSPLENVTAEQLLSAVFPTYLSIMEANKEALRTALVCP